MPQKIFIKETPSTINNGTAGLPVVHVEGKEVKENGSVVLTLYVRDMDKQIAGPYEINQEDTEVRDV